MNRFLLLSCLLMSGCFETSRVPPLQITFPKLELDPRLIEGCPTLPLLLSGDEKDIVTNYGSLTAAHLECVKRERALAAFLLEVVNGYGQITEDVLRQVDEHNKALSNIE